MYYSLFDYLSVGASATICERLQVRYNHDLQFYMYIGLHICLGGFE